MNNWLDFLAGAVSVTVGYVLGYWGRRVDRAAHQKETENES